MKLYHQVGHNANWNIESFEQDECGDGLILSPVHQTKESIDRIAQSTKDCSLFDPQFYLPNSQKQKLRSYDFFPETIASGFTTSTYAARANEAAQRCIAFQVEQGFSGIVIPARHYEDMISDYADRQASYTVDPFLRELARIRPQKTIWLTLPLTAGMIEDTGYYTRLLNWVTSYPEIDGVYVVIEFSRKTKQIQSTPFLRAQLEFFLALRNADLQVIAGHVNTEGLLLGLVDGCAITCGAFENTRMFSNDKFVSSDDKRGPRARIYLAGLLNWIQFSQAREIMQDRDDIWRAVYRANAYGDSALSSPTEPAFNQPALYKHFFLSFAAQVAELRSNDLQTRYETLRAWLQQALQSDEAIHQGNFDLELHGRGDHLQHWLDAINAFFRHHLA